MRVVQAYARVSDRKQPTVGVPAPAILALGNPFVCVVYAQHETAPITILRHRGCCRFIWGKRVCSAYAPHQQAMELQMVLFALQLYGSSLASQMTLIVNLHDRSCAVRYCAHCTTRGAGKITVRFSRGLVRHRTDSLRGSIVANFWC